MILLVPINPEVPHALKPKIWPSILMVCILIIAFFLTKDTIRSDYSYVESVESDLTKTDTSSAHLDLKTETYLRSRPLLEIAPAKGSWDFQRLIKANFLHGSFSHLVFNSIGIFAGVRICTTFIPFISALAIFLIGGSLGLWVSVITSQQISDFIPHVGASSGLFALMGTYYFFNFRFRTQYFFWLPIRRGFVSLKTSWFFFVDVILLELVLSAAQLFPDRIDSVDHIAHVVGFLSGIFLAMGYRLVLRWPNFLQTRAEYLYWHHFGQHHSRNKDHKIEVWLELLRINRYNDFLKRRLCSFIKRKSIATTDPELNEVFKFFVPTFVRLNTSLVSSVIKTLIEEERPIPQRWLSKMPYDILLRLAKSLASSSRDQRHLYKFLVDYKRSQEPKGKGKANVDKLMARLEQEIPSNSETSQSKKTG